MAEALSNVLPQYPALWRLYLASNQIGNSGCWGLSNALPECPKLSKLDLSYNQIGDSGCVRLASLSSVTKLSTLDLHSNQIGASVKSELENKTVKNRNGKTIWLRLSGTENIIDSDIDSDY